MIVPLQCDVGGGNDAFVLNFDDLAKLFGTRHAVKVNWVRAYPVSWGTPTEIVIRPDWDVRVDESDGGATQAIFTQVAQLSDIQGDTGIVERVTRPNLMYIRFNAENIAPITTTPSGFEIHNNLVIGWSANLDFILVFDLTELPTLWDTKFKLMDLLAGKTQVEDPNLSNVDGKRSLRRAGLLHVED